MNRSPWRVALPVAAIACMAGANLQAQTLMPAAGNGGLRMPGAAAATPAAPQLTTPPAVSASADDGIAAVVGNQVITRYDLDLRVQSLQQQLAREQGGATPPAGQLRAQVLKDMIDEYALAEFAEQSGIEVSDATLERALQQVAGNNHLSVDDLRRQVADQGMGWKDFRAQIRREVLIARLRQRDVASKVNVSDQEIDDYLAAQHARQGQIAGNTQLHLAQIFVPLPDQPSAEQLKGARTVIDDAAAALRQGKRFSAVAREFSMDQQAAQGGDMGVRPASQWPSLFVQAVRDLQPGQVTGVIRSPAGFHILELVARQDASPLPQTAMQAHVREIVIRADGDASRKSAVHELQGVRRAVEAGEVSFEAKAKEISQDLGSARDGGDLGWVLPGQLPAALDAALEGLNPGEVSQPLQLPGKIVLLQLVDRREHALAQGQERAVVRSMLLQQKEAKAFKDLVDDVRARTYVRMPGDDS